MNITAHVHVTIQNICWSEIILVCCVDTGASPPFQLKKFVLLVTYFSFFKLLSTQYNFVLVAVRRSSYARASSGLLQYVLEACVAQILPEKSHLNVEKLLRAPPLSESFSIRSWLYKLTFVAPTFSQ